MMSVQYLITVTLVSIKAISNLHIRTSSHLI